MKVCSFSETQFAQLVRGMSSGHIAGRQGVVMGLDLDAVETVKVVWGVGVEVSSSLGNGGSQ